MTVIRFDKDDGKLIAVRHGSCPADWIDEARIRRLAARHDRTGDKWFTAGVADPADGPTHRVETDDKGDTLVTIYTPWWMMEEVAA